MTRLVWWLVPLLLLAAACGDESSSSQPTDEAPTDSGESAAAVQERVDPILTEVVEGLERALGAQTHLSGHWSQCQMSDDVHYVGNGQIVEPTLPAPKLRPAIERVLRDAGLELGSDTSDAVASADGLTVHVDGIEGLGATKVPVLTLTFETECARYADQDEALQREGLDLR